MNLLMFPPAADQPDIEELYFEFPIGSTGAVGTATRARGVASMTRNSTGDYTLTLDSGVQKIVQSHIYLVYSTVALTDSQIVRIKAETAAATSFVRFEVWTQGVGATSTSGALTDPASGAIIKGCIKVQNTAV